MSMSTWDINDLPSYGQYYDQGYVDSYSKRGIVESFSDGSNQKNTDAATKTKSKDGVYEFKITITCEAVAYVKKLLFQLAIVVLLVVFITRA